MLTILWNQPRPRAAGSRAAGSKRKAWGAIVLGDRKREQAVEEAAQALSQAEAAKTAKARRDAVKRVFAALAKAQADADEREALRAEAEAMADASAAQVRVTIMALHDEIRLELARLQMRRQEDEELFLLRMWAG